MFRLTFTGVLLGSVFFIGCARHADGARVASASTLVTEGEVEIQRARVSVADTTGATISAPTPEPASDDDDDFDEMPLVKAPALEDLGNAESMKRALRWLRWVAPVNDEAQPR